MFIWFFFFFFSHNMVHQPYNVHQLTQSQEKQKSKLSLDYKHKKDLHIYYDLKVIKIHWYFFVRDPLQCGLKIPCTRVHIPVPRTFMKYFIFIEFFFPSKYKRNEMGGQALLSIYQIRQQKRKNTFSSFSISIFFFWGLPLKKKKRRKKTFPIIFKSDSYFSQIE